MDRPIVNLFWDHHRPFAQLAGLNAKVKQISQKFTYAQEGEGYDFAHNRISGWFNPDNVRHLGFSRCYPNKCPEQYRREYNLSIHQSNYLCILLLNLLYRGRPDVLIEDIGAGAGVLFGYLKLLGFKNFHAIDNFTQLPQNVFETYMRDFGITPKINDLSCRPVISNNVGVPSYPFRAEAKDNLELVCCYTNRTLEKMLAEWAPANGFKFLCRDEDDICVAYCRADKYDAFRAAIAPFVCNPQRGMQYIPQYVPIVNDCDRIAVNEYMQAPGFLTEYKNTEAFEKAIQDFLGVRHCITVNNGTISLALALLACGIKPMDNVLVPDITMIATPNAVRLIGAKPVLADVDDSLLLDVAWAGQILRRWAIKAVILVTLNGRTYDNRIWPFIELCRANRIAIIEDSAQSFGSKNYEGHFLGARYADIGSFSFSSPKIITTGQGGCLVTNNDALATHIRHLKDFGRATGGNDIHDYFGINSKFTELQAVIGLEQLKDIDYRMARKKVLFDLYRQQLSCVPAVEFIQTDLSYVTPWFVDIYVEDPNGLQTYLHAHGIGSRLVYPPIHTQKIYADIAGTVRQPHRYYGKGLWLPSSFTVTDAQVERICETIKDYFNV